MLNEELNIKSNQLANYLRSYGLRANDIVGIMLPRSLELIITILAVLKAGSCYIPIDPTYPEKRISYMLENSSSKVVITLNHLYDNIDFDKDVTIYGESV